MNQHPAQFILRGGNELLSSQYQTDDGISLATGLIDYQADNCVSSEFLFHSVKRNYLRVVGMLVYILVL